MITFTGGPFDGEMYDEEYPFDEIHFQRHDDEPVYIYIRDEDSLNYQYQGEFASWEVKYTEDDDEE